MGHTLTSSVFWALLPIPHFCLDYSTHFALCQDFFSPRGKPLFPFGWHRVSRAILGVAWSYSDLCPRFLGLPSLPLGVSLLQHRFCALSRLFFIFFWGSSLFVPLFIPPEGCSYFVNAASVLQRIFAAYNLAGVVSQSAGFGFSFPLSDLIIAQGLCFVKHFFLGILFSFVPVDPLPPCACFIPRLVSGS